jgi:hypothetical protein
MMENWQDLWEKHAAEERRRMECRPVRELLSEVARGLFGDYYTVWYVIAERASLCEAAWILYGVLESGADYLHRYHCARALLTLMHYDGMEPADLSAEHSGLLENLAALGSMLDGILRPSPGNSGTHREREK